MVAVVKACTAASQVPGVSRGLWISNVGQCGRNDRRSEQEQHLWHPAMCMITRRPLSNTPNLIAMLPAQVTKPMQGLDHQRRQRLELSIMYVMSDIGLHPNRQ